MEAGHGGNENSCVNGGVYHGEEEGPEEWRRT